MIQFKTRELATVLAALAYWKREGLNADPVRELNIATDDGLHDLMTEGEIDALADRLAADPDTKGVRMAPPSKPGEEVGLVIGGQGGPKP